MKRKPRNEPKLGTPYQNLVASVVKAMDPACVVNEEEWRKGPDGLREIDVSITGFVKGKPFFALMECKDWKKPIGIGHVDALDSKRADMKADIAFICSNSGFTADALTKAARVEIHLVTALKKGDKRVRTVIEREIYPRYIMLTSNNVRFHFAGSYGAGPSDVKAEAVLYEGQSITNWFFKRLLLIFQAQTNISNIEIHLRFPTAFPMYFPEEREFLVTAIDFIASCTTKWHSQVIRLNASAGIYNYILGKPVVGGNSQIHIENFSTDVKTWKEIDFVPGQKALELLVGGGESSMELMMVGGMIQQVPGGVPDFDRFVVSEVVA